MNKQESVGWDAENNQLVITKQERVSVDGATGIEDAFKKIDKRLADIVRTVKGLKAEAEALKSLKERLKVGVNSVGSVSESPAPEEAQSASAETPQSK